jgi:hypothetical protein
VQQVRSFPQLEEEAMAEATLVRADSPRRPRDLSVSFAPLPAQPASAAGSSPKATTAQGAAAPSITTSRVKPAPASICSAVAAAADADEAVAAADADETAAAAAFAALPPWCRAVVFDAQAVPGVSPRPSSRQTPGESHKPPDTYASQESVVSRAARPALGVLYCSLPSAILPAVHWQTPPPRPSAVARSTPPHVPHEPRCPPLALLQSHAAVHARATAPTLQQRPHLHKLRLSLRSDTPTTAQLLGFAQKAESLARERRLSNLTHHNSLLRLMTLPQLRGLRDLRYSAPSA